MKPFFLPIGFLLSLPTWAETASTSLLDTAQQLVASLGEDEKKQALFPFQDKERESWHYVPRDREGLRIDALNDTQTIHLQSLLSASLSKQGRATSEEVIQLETLLYEKSDKSDFRNPGKYALSVFGSPSTEQPWGWRFEGHHLSLNFTVVSDKVTLTTPFFFGTNPAEVREGEHKGLRPLGTIEDAARKLALALHTDGLHVRFSTEAPKEILTGQERSVTALAKEGVAYSDLKEEQQSEFLKLVQLIAASQRSEFLAIKEDHMKSALLAWSGEFELGKPHYFRVQTDTFLIEFANTQNKGNHAHLVWRDFKNDFGRDLLKEHLEHEH